MLKRPTSWSPPIIEAAQPVAGRSRWTGLCQLELPQEASADGLECVRWRVELRAPDGELVLRQVVHDKMIVSGRSRLLDLEPNRFVRPNPETMVLHRVRSDGQQTPPLTLPVPAAFRRRSADLIRWVLDHEIPEKTISFCPIGGLANQLFQAGAMIGFARRHNVPWVCEVWKTCSPSMKDASWPTYWNSVFAEVVHRSEGIRRNPLLEHNYGDPSYTYTEIPAQHEHQILWGHYLSYKYFHPERDELLNLLYGARNLQQEVDEAYRLQLAGRDKPLVSIHVRRGDSLANNTLTRINMRYYREAMDRFQGAVFAVFSDDIPWCRRRFEGKNVIFVEGNPAAVDLFLMARCDHHIIANSTFSWWSAYLNRKAGRRVIYPMPWFVGEKRKRDMSDFFLPDWSEQQLRD